MQEDRDLEDFGPVCSAFGENGTDSINDIRRLVLDTTGDDGAVDQGDLAADKDQVAELGTAGQSARLGTEVLDRVLPRGDGGVGDDGSSGGHRGQECGRKGKGETHGEK